LRWFAAKSAACQHHEAHAVTRGAAPVMRSSSKQTSSWTSVRGRWGELGELLADEPHLLAVLRVSGPAARFVVALVLHRV
jgi:hypothetical protein